MATPSFGVRVDVDWVCQNSHCGFLYLDGYDLKTSSTEINFSPCSPVRSKLSELQGCHSFIQEPRPPDTSFSSVSVCLSSAPLATPVKSIPGALKAAVSLGAHYVPCHWMEQRGSDPMPSSPVFTIAFPTL